MPTAEEFDEFYVSTRRDLVLQTFALTGDLAASRNAVRDAYTAARHHWDKVGRSSDPAAWVRPRAWSRAQARHSISPWHRDRHVDAEHTATLEALHQLKDTPRRTLVLVELTDLSLDQVAREIGVPLPQAAEHRDAAIASVSAALGCEPGAIRDRLLGLGSAVDTVKLPRPSIVRRNGLRRRRNVAVAGSVAITAVLVSAGGFVAVGTTTDPAARSQARELVKETRTALLSETQIAALAPGQTWAKPTTSQNDDQNSSGLNTSCQQERFADRAADGALVRTFGTASGLPRRFVQSVEISRSTSEAEAAYATTTTWYAGCRANRIQLVSSFDLGQVGDQARVLLLAGPRPGDPSYAVGLARSGKLTVSTVLEVTRRTQVPLSALTGALASSVRNLCTSPAAGACVGQPTQTASRPPASGEVPGMLASVDLPAVADVRASWNGTPPVPASPNTAATPCDKADFTRAGAVGPIGRSYLLSNQNAPKVFGVTETIGRFPTARAASRFVDQIISRMRSCERRILSSTIASELVRPGSAKAPRYARWRVVNQTQSRAEVAYWMGVTQVGTYVSQVSMTPSGKYDVGADTFTDLVLRSRDRLFEIS